MLPSICLQDLSDPQYLSGLNTSGQDLFYLEFIIMELKNSQLAARFTGRSAVLAPVEADEITGAVESAFGGDFRNGEVGIFQQFFSAGKAKILQIAERRSSAVVRKELTQQRHADSGMLRRRLDRDGTSEIFMQEFEGFAEFRVLSGGEGLFLLESGEPLQKAQQQSRCPRKIVFLGHIAQFKKHADGPRLTAKVKRTPVLGEKNRIRLKNTEDVVFARIIDLVMDHLRRDDQQFAGSAFKDSGRTFYPAMPVEYIDQFTAAVLVWSDIACYLAPPRIEEQRQFHRLYAHIDPFR